MENSALKIIRDESKEKPPRHIAIIMDGNGRWAQERGLSRLRGHRAGAEAVRRVVTDCAELGIEYLTLYAFSLENWKRPQTEVRGLMRYLKGYLQGELELMQRNKIRLRAIGRLDLLPAGVQRALNRSVQATAANPGLTLVLALNYGGRAEIVDGVKGVMRDGIAGRIGEKDLDERRFSRYLYTRDLPDPDLLIRTSGEMRVSNFLLWQISYTEFWSTPVYWPDFNREHLLAAIEDFRRRKRRYGGLDFSG